MVKRQSVGEPLSLTGKVQDQTEVALAFRIDARLLKRDAGVVGGGADPDAALSCVRIGRRETSLGSASESR